MKFSQSTDRLLGLFAIILISLAIAFMTEARATGTPRTEQEQSQDQSQDQHSTQYNSQNQGNEQSATVNNTSSTKVYAAGASSGDSSSTCQKVRDLRIADGFLFGIRWDMTDQDCRRLGVADKAYARGDTYFGDTLTCTVPFVLGAFESVDDCKTQLERNDVTEALQERIRILEAQKASALAERAADQKQCEASKNAIIEGCTRK